MNDNTVVRMPNAAEALQQYKSPAAFLEKEKPVGPVYLLYPKRFHVAARRFLNSFPGATLYAIKANPAPQVVDLIYEAGIRHFDTASLPEIEFIRGRYHRLALPFHGAGAFSGRRARGRARARRARFRR